MYESTQSQGGSECVRGGVHESLQFEKTPWRSKRGVGGKRRAEGVGVDVACRPICALKPNCYVDSICGGVGDVGRHDLLLGESEYGIPGVSLRLQKENLLRGDRLEDQQERDQKTVMGVGEKRSDRFWNFAVHANGVNSCCLNCRMAKAYNCIPSLILRRPPAA
jgi:hypothetical protein